MGIFSFANRKSLPESSPVERYIFLAFISVALTPFFLPKMHDRFFFLADIFSLLIAMMIPSYWFLPVFYQLISGLSIYIFLYLLDYIIAGNINMLNIATLLNVVVSIPLYWLGINERGLDFLSGAKQETKEGSGFL